MGKKVETSEERNERHLSEAYDCLGKINKMTEDDFDIKINPNKEMKYEFCNDDGYSISVSNVFGVLCYVNGVFSGMSYQKCNTCNSRLACELKGAKYGDKYCRKQIKHMEYQYELKKPYDKEVEEDE